MKQRNILRLLVIASFILILTSAAFIPSAYAAYTYTTVNMPGSDSTKAHDINSAGMVVGHYLSGGTWYGFTFDGTTYTSYEMPGSSSTRFTGINDNGDITGEYIGIATDWIGFIYDGSTWTSLAVPDAARTDPRGINDAGHVAGWNRDAGYCAAYGFLYDGSSFTTIDYPGTDESLCAGGPPPLDEQRVLDINNAGKLVGFYVIDTALHGFTYEGGSYNTFDYPGSPVSYATGINDVGQIVGAFDDNGTWKTYVYDNGTWEELFIPGSSYTVASGINNNGLITGYYNDGISEYGFIATPSESGRANIPQTGQTISYYAGDDGSFQAGVAWPTTGNMGSGRFNDNGDGTVTDLLTGLMWAMSANNGPVNFYSARDAAGALSTGGYTDWRIPNMLELESLTHAGEADTSAWLNSEGFSGVQAAEYWSNNAYSLSTSGWTINLGTDQTNYWMDWNTATRHYWPVRGGANGAADPAYPGNIRKTGSTTSVTAGDDGDLEWGVTWPAPRFIDNLDGTMTDNLTGLMWPKDGGMGLIGGSFGVISDFTEALDFIDDMNSGNNGRCVADPSNLPRCYPWENSCGPGNNQPCPLPKTDCPADFTCFGAVEASPWNSWPVTGAQYGECKRNTVDNPCNSVSDCPAIIGGELPGTYNDLCVALPNAGYTDWRLANKKEMYSLVNMEDEFSTDELTAAGFTVPDFAWCSHWTSTADPADPNNMVFGVTLNTAGHQMLTYPLVGTAGPLSCNWTYVPQFVWPVRTAAAPAPDPDISVTPSSYDFGAVEQGTELDVTITINNFGNADLSIISIGQNDTIDPPFSIVTGQDNCTGTAVAPGGSCTFDVRFSPIGRGSYNDTFDIESNDPDTNMLIVSVTGIGTTAYVTELPQTGQTTSYSAGDDGSFQAGVAWPTTGNMGSGRFNDNGDGTVTDLLTGLMWAMSANNGPVNFYSARDAAGALSTGGYTDWRIPNMLELESLTHAGEADTSAWLNSEGFSGVQAAEYWSNNAYSLSTSGWTINLGTDQTNYWMDWNTATRHYWPVRGGANGAADPAYPGNIRKTGSTTSVTAGDDGDLEWGVTWPAPRFIDNLDGTMTDNLTGLMWPKDGGMGLIGGSFGVISDFTEALDFIDDMNSGNNGRCVADPSNLPRCYPWENSCGPGNNQPCPLPKTDCPADFTCFGAVEASPWNSWPVTGAQYGECKRNTVDNPCNSVSDCPAIIGGELPGTYNDLCVALPNAGYTDWRLANKKEMYSLVNMEDEFSTDELTAAGFTVPDFAWCSHWTSTADPADPNNMVFGVTLNTAGHQMLTYPLVGTAGPLSCNWTYVPQFVWPVRTAAAPAPAPDPDISVTPSSYDFGGVDIGLTSSTAFTVENVGNGDLDITSVSLPLSDFSVQSEDCTTLSPLAPQGTCTISVDFTPSAQGVVSEDLTIVSNDPDTGTLTVNVSGTGIPTVTEIDLELDKYVNNSTPFVGSRVTFTAAVTNNGPSDATGVEVKDVVPDGFSSIQSISHGGTEADGTITWSGLNINAGVTRNLRFSVVVHASGNYTNVAQVTAADQTDSDSAPDNDDGDQSEDDEDSEGVSPVSAIDLELDKSVNNPLPDAGSPVTFTVSVTNEGNLDATGVSVQDVVPDGYSNIRNISHGGTEAGGIITWSGMNINMGTTNWYDTGWSYRQKITINSSQVSGDLTDFPVLISTTDTDLIVAPGGNVGKASGGDIVFTNSNGTRKYDHEIESYNSATGELVAWVKVPHVSSTADTEMYMYYGNAGAADQWNVNGTWDSNYAGVWHLSEDPSGTAPQMQDSTVNSNAGASGGNMTSANQVAGLADGSLDFDGVDDKITVPLDDSLKPVSEITVSAWIRTPDGGDSNGIVDTFRYGPRTGYLIETGTGTSGDVFWSIGGDNAVAYTYFSGPLNDDEWHHITGTFNGQDMKLYVDGVLKDTKNTPYVGAAFPTALAYSAIDLAIGLWENDFYYSGHIDEVRVAGTERTADWILTSYNNQNNPSSFTNFDAQEIFIQASTIDLTFDVDVNGSGNYVNVAQVTAADQTDSDSMPDNDDGDQSEDDEDNAVVFVPGTSYPVLSQPRTSPGDPYPCNLWAGQPYQWCDPATWPSNSVYAAPWDDADITNSSSPQVLAENFQLYIETTITEIKTWGGYWWQDIAPASDNFTLIIHNDSGGTIGTMVAQPAFMVNRALVATNVRMPYTATQAGSSDIYEYTFTLTETLTLAPGTYWVEFFNDTTGHTANNDFFWVWARLDPVNERGLDGLAWTNASAPGSNWNIDTEGNLAIEMNGVATGAAGCTLLVRNVDTLAEYCTIQEAYTQAGGGETIQSQAIVYTEDLDFTIEKTVIIQGGYDGSYTSVIGNTTLNGNVTSTAGTVIMGDFILEQ